MTIYATEKIYGTAQQVISSTTDIGAGNFGGAGTDFDPADAAVPNAMFIQAMVEMPDWASAPAATATLELWGLAINTDGTDDDTDAPSGTASGGAQFLCSFPLAAADALQRRTMEFPNIFENGFTPYVKNTSAVNLNNDGGTPLVVKLKPWTLGTEVA